MTLLALAALNTLLAAALVAGLATLMAAPLISVRKAGVRGLRPAEQPLDLAA
jgi:hypothetical protein